MLQKFKLTARRIVIGASTITTGCVCAYLIFGVVQDRHRLNFVPPELKVSKVIYFTKNSWGFGAGGNETGVVAFELPVDSANALLADGISYLQMSESKYSANSLDYSWHLTPVLLEGSDSNTNRNMSLEINDYLNRYGFGIEIDPKVRHEINTAISQRGNFVAYMRYGIIIIAPNLRKVFYVYNG